MFHELYSRRKILLTGHTGFKGSWLALWLQHLGAEVTGISLPPLSDPAHWSLLNLPAHSHSADVRDAGEIDRLITAARPEIVFHLAAQPLVRRSYQDPLETWNTNVMGTANVLEACRSVDSVRAIVVITTDKCYDNKEWVWGYRENDPLGGHDPYSASKACCELLADSYRKSFFSAPGGPLLATARAGNVIGGGDWSTDRLIPDVIRAVASGQALQIRSPRATRPWQHVLECLSGYLLLGQHLLEGRREHAQAWNFGPEPESNRSVEEVINQMAEHYPGLTWRNSGGEHPHEARALYLDNSKARHGLGWRPVWSFSQTVRETALWYQQWQAARKVISKDQLLAYVDAAARLGLSWAKDEA